MKKHFRLIERRVVYIISSTFKLRSGKSVNVTKIKLPNKGRHPSFRTVHEFWITKRSVVIITTLKHVLRKIGTVETYAATVTKTSSTSRYYQEQEQSTRV